MTYGARVFCSFLIVLLPSLCAGLYPSLSSTFLIILIDKSKTQGLAQDPYWHRLLHYQKGILGGYKSTVKTPTFFLSKKGYKDPEEELTATLKGFFDSSLDLQGKDHPQCRFPARYDWLKEKLDFPTDGPTPACTAYRQWLKRLEPKSVSLIFASSYMNNPSSMYGHTFLRINKEKAIAGQDLMDFAFSYGALAGVNRGFLYALKGLTGGYHGGYSTIPYHVQVMKYNNVGSRDIWEYKLHMDPIELNRFMAHLWEIRDVQKKYYFLNRNCSYEMLKILDVAKPRYEFSKHFRWRAIPIDTIKVFFSDSGLISTTTVRPALHLSLLDHRARLSEVERKLAARIVHQKEKGPLGELQKWQEERQAAVLDTAFLYLRFLYGFDRNQTDEFLEKESRLLQLRSKLKSAGPARPFDYSYLPKPHLSHGSGRLTVGFGAGNDDKSFEEFSIRGSLHDLEDDPYGYISGSGLEMFTLKLRAENQREKGYVEDFGLFDITSLAPWDPWIWPISWRVRLGGGVARDIVSDPEDNLSAGVEGGAGASIRLPTQKQGFMYLFWEGDLKAGSQFEDKYRLGSGARGGILVSPWDRFRIHFNASVLRYPLGNVGHVVTFNLVQNYVITRRWNVRAKLTRTNGYKEAVLSINHYF